MASTAHADCVLGQKLAWTERLSAEELHAYQAPLLAKLLDHARRTTDFYKDRFEFDVGHPDRIEKTWSKIPILTRAEAIANGEKLKSRSTPPEIGPIVDLKSSGSTGMPFRFKRTAEARRPQHGPGRERGPHPTQSIRTATPTTHNSEAGPASR